MPGQGEADVYLPPFRAAVLAFFLGTAFIIGGPERIAGPSYATLRQFGGEIIWGIGFLMVAVILLAASKFSARVLFHAYMAAATGYALFALAVLDAARQLETGGLTGIVVYTWVSWIHILAAAANSHGRFAFALLALHNRLRTLLRLRDRRGSDATTGSP
ncbi:hypothetical protein CH305_18540 [Rhodococcus sp. 15-649-2-2]|uniref:hypothetical protein n=1 Tax=Rhodococcus sp. 15-649-2-2 TaxID=2023140 RepID=UPI000B9B57DD|nr:hypothetical protein [Rhodococcus sp. 15-649-2-2]OZE77235.1 hypothetical protein CH305_18540 [Rhodococcus sp. 15-649-2-2]